MLIEGAAKGAANGAVENASDGKVESAVESAGGDFRRDRWGQTAIRRITRQRKSPRSTRRCARATGSGSRMVIPDPMVVIKVRILLNGCVEAGAAVEEGDSLGPAESRPKVSPCGNSTRPRQGY